VTPLVVAAGIGFSILGVIAERLASVWPSDEASRRRPGARTILLAIGAALAGAAVAWRSALPLWGTLVYLAFLAILVLLAATDLEQRRLPHLLLDPLIVGAIVFVPFNPAIDPLDAVIGAAVGVAVLGLLGLVVRGGLALGDLYLAGPLGLLLGFPGIIGALFLAALLVAVTSLGLLAARRVGLRSYVPFGPFLVMGTVLTLLRDPQILGHLGAAARGAMGLATRVLLGS
jgi:prepilin signal peptidase PulO-like enzyme (type II secretory pathway)